MKCPKCSSMETKVIDSRVVDDGQTIRRRRECEFCTNRFTTFERLGFTELMNIKKDKKRELYNRQKLKKAIMLAFAKREFGADEIENILNSLENNWTSMWNEISSKKIGDDVLEALKNVDIVAYFRFASVYKSFDNLEDLQKFVSSN